MSASPRFGALVGAAVISDAGDWVLAIGLPVYVFALTGSATSTAAVFVAELVPALLMGLVAGAVLDRLDLRRALATVSVVQGALLTALLAVSDAGDLWIVFVVAGAEAALARLAGPARAALVPSLVEPAELTRANGRLAVADNVARLVGSPLGGIVVEAGGLRAVVALDGLSYVLCAGLVLAVRPRLTSPAAAETAKATPMAAQITDGLRVVWRSGPLRAVVGVTALGQLAQGVFLVLFVVFMARELGSDGAETGVVRGAQAVGGTAGGLAVGWFARRVAPGRLVGLGFVALGAVSVVAWNAPAVTTAPVVYAVLFAGAGLPAVVAATGVITIAQRHAPATHMGRVFAAIELGATAMQGVGLLLAGVLADRLGLITILDAQAAVYLGAGILALATLSTGRAAPAPAGRAPRLDHREDGREREQARRDAAGHDEVRGGGGDARHVAADARPLATNASSVPERSANTVRPTARTVITRRSPRVTAGEELQAVAVRVGEVDAAPAVHGVDLARPTVHGIGPVGHAGRPQAGERLVEGGVVDAERVVLGVVGLAAGGRVVEDDAVGDADRDERAGRRADVDAEDLGQEPCRRVLVAGPDDGVVELDAHGGSFSNGGRRPDRR